MGTSLQARQFDPDNSLLWTHASSQCPPPGSRIRIVLLSFAAVPAVEIVPLETVSETSSNASIDDRTEQL
jgi:hypothetical protein